jgi:hypothetical protein
VRAREDSGRKAEAGEFRRMDITDTDPFMEHDIQF